MTIIEKLSEHDQSFEPPVALKRTFLSVRHAEYTRAKISVPGLFNLEDAGKDALYFGAAVIAEVAGMGLLVVAADFTPMWAAITVAFALFFDVLLAYGAHSAKPYICEFVVKKLLAPSAREADFCDDEIRGKRRWREFPFNFLIIASGAGKIAGFILAYVVRGGHEPDPLVGFLILLYIAIALIHIYKTGYAVAAATLLIRLSQAYKEYLRGDEGYRFHAPVHYAKDLPQIKDDIKVGRHVLNRYGLSTSGVLMDREVQGLCDKAPDEHKHDVMSLCLLAQHQILNSAPSPPQTTTPTPLLAVGTAPGLPAQAVPAAVAVPLPPLPLPPPPNKLGA